MMETTQNQYSRRDFVKTSAALSLGTIGLIRTRAYAAGSDTLRVGLIGCGGRGRGAAVNILDAAPGVELYALGDLFQEPLDAAFRQLSQTRPESPMTKMGNTINVTRDRCFVGFDAYQKVIDCGVDVVLMATPPNGGPLSHKSVFFVIFGGFILRLTKLLLKAVLVLFYVKSSIF